MFYLGFALLGLAALLLTLCPERIVSWHANMYRSHYPTPEARTTLDQAQEWNPLSRWMIGKMSDYALEGAEAPQRFPRMVTFIRSVGTVLLFFVGVALAMMLFQR